MIYIITYHIFNNYTNIITRYYTIEIYNLYNLKVAYDAKSIIFNSFFVGAFTFYNKSNYSSHIIIFSYPDSKDFEIDLIAHLKNYGYYFPLEDIVQNQITINNNLFGLVMKGVQIQTFPKYNDTIVISLFSHIKNDLIKEDEIIDIKDKIEFIFTQSELSSGEYKIEYAGVVTEPNFEEYNLYCEIDSTNGIISEEKKEFEKSEYIGKTGYIFVKINESLTNQCIDQQCFYCLQNDKNNCVFFRKESENCTIDEIYDNKCIDQKISKNQSEEIYNKLKYLVQNSYKGENKIIRTLNYVFQLSTLEDQKISENLDLSSIDLGECEYQLKRQNDLTNDDSLIILKVDIKNEDLSLKSFKYEIYNPKNKDKLEICNDTQIIINFPIKRNDGATILYDI